jgi:hypothetical protein
MNSTANQFIYTAENPRRSKRNLDKSPVKYYTEQDEIADAIDAICTKRGWEFSQDLITEFETWLPTAGPWDTRKYDCSIGCTRPKTKLEIAKDWVRYHSYSIYLQKKQIKFSKALFKYCQKNGFNYNSLINKRFTEWRTDPINNMVTYYYSPYYNRECSNEYPTTFCIKEWFVTLDKDTIATMRKVL